MNKYSPSQEFVRESRDFFSAQLYQNDATNHTLSDVAAKLDEINKRLQTLEKKEPTVVLRASEVESIASKIASGTSDLEQLVMLQQQTARHSVMKKWILLTAFIALIVLCSVLGYKYYSDSTLRNAEAIAHSKAGKYWDTDKAALTLLKYGRNYRSEANKYRKIVGDEDNWTMLALLAKTEIPVVIIDGAVTIEDGDTAMAFFHIIDKEGKPRSVLVKGLSSTEITALASPPISRSKYRKISKINRARDVIEKLDWVAIFENGKWKLWEAE